MYFQLVNSTTRVQVADVSALYSHAEDFRRHAVRKHVWRPKHAHTPLCSLFSRCPTQNYLGETHGPQPRPFEHVELIGRELDAFHTPTGPERHFYIGEALHITRYQAVIHGATFTLWGTDVGDALRRHGYALETTTDGALLLNGAQVGSYSLIG